MTSLPSTPLGMFAGLLDRSIAEIALKLSAETGADLEIVTGDVAAIVVQFRQLGLIE